MALLAMRNIDFAYTRIELPANLTDERNETSLAPRKLNCSGGDASTRLRIGGGAMGETPALRRWTGESCTQGLPLCLGLLL
jgi:hypothetical protein